MQRVLVTGANKGIGLAIVEAILTRDANTFVYLAARDPERGEQAVAKLSSEHPGWGSRLAFVSLDVTSDRSITEAVASLGGQTLHGLVNNAGIGRGNDLATILKTNTVGVRQVCEAFLPLLEPKGGRIVNVTSASGPIFVSQCSPERQRFFLDANATWPQLQALIEECLALGNNPAAFAEKGLGDGDAYGLSKACANVYTMLLAREHPGLKINACTPGYIATDLTRPYAEAQQKSPAELGMKPPSEGAHAPMHLLFGALEGNGRYYGSDARRSPLDRYRAPGSPEFTGP